MEFCHSYLFVTFVVMTVDQIVGRDDGPLFKLLQNDPETGRIFSQPPLISFKRDKNVGNFLVRSALKTHE